jgi:hypothetical protein
LIELRKSILEDISEEKMLTKFQEIDRMTGYIIDHVNNILLYKFKGSQEVHFIKIFNNDCILPRCMKTSYKGIHIEISDEMAGKSIKHDSAGHEHSSSNMNMDMDMDMPMDMGGVKIGGKDVHLISLTDGSFVSHYFPYITSKTKLELAQNLIDYVPQFGGKAYEAAKKE